MEAGHVTLLPMPSIDHTVDHTVDQDVVQDIQDIESNVGVASLTVSQYVAVLFDFFGYYHFKMQKVGTRYIQVFTL